MGGKRVRAPDNSVARLDPAAGLDWFDILNANLRARVYEDLNWRAQWFPLKRLSRYLCLLIALYKILVLEVR